MNAAVAVALQLNILTWITGGRIVNALNYDTKKDLQTGALLAERSTVSQGLFAAPFAAYKAGVSGFARDQALADLSCRSGQLDFLPGVDKAPAPQPKEKRKADKLKYGATVDPLKAASKSLQLAKKQMDETLSVIPIVRDKRPTTSTPVSGLLTQGVSTCVTLMQSPKGRVAAHLSAVLIN